MPSHMNPSQKGRKKQEKSGRKSRLWLIPVVLLAVLAVAYAGGVVAFNFFFMPGTTLGGEDVSLRPVSEIAAEKGSSLDDFETHVTGDGLDLTVRASDIGLTCDGDAYAQSALSQINVWLWPYEVFQTREVSAEAGSSFDEQALSELVTAAVDAVVQGAGESGGTDIAFNAEQGRFALDENAVRRHLSADAVTERVTRALNAQETEVQIGEDCLDVGDSLTTALDAANAYVAAAPLTLTLAGQHAYDVTAEQIAGWVRIADDLTVSLDAEAIDTWGHGELSDLLDTAGDERTYTRPDGAVFTVNDGARAYGRSSYGWIIDGGAAAQQVIAAIQAGQPATLDLPTLQTAAAIAPGGQDWPNRYIDVDLTAQHAIFYDNGTVIWEADITSGQPSLGNETPTGVWVVDSRKSRANDGDINLKGPIDPETGEPEWDSHVDFWVGFVGNGGSRNGNLIGFHNAPWQYAPFGGSTYTWNGSHGCVRLSYASGEALYNVVQKGDVVVVHK